MKFVGKLCTFLCATLILSVGQTTQISAQSFCEIIDFEFIPNSNLQEGLLIDDQFYASQGITFALEDGNSPRIAQIGEPATAFESSLGFDIPLAGQNIDSYFLTDDGKLSGLESSPLIVSFSTPIDSASGDVLDVDFGETFTIQARDQADGVLFETIISAGEPDTGDGLATRWGFKRIFPDIYSIKFIGIRETPGAFGLGFDNFVSCRLEESTFINEEKIGLVNVYPNPSNGNLIVFAPNTAIDLIELYDLKGSRLDFEWSLGGDKVNVLCKHKGPVLMSIILDGNLVTKKLILE